MANNLTLSVTLTGDGRQLSGTLRNAQGEVQAFGGSTVREGDRAERSLANVERRAGTVGRELQVLRRLAAPLGAAFGGMFAGRALQSQVDFADRLQKTNLRIGASVEALSQYNHVAGLSGVAFEQLTTGWQRQTRRISEAAQGYGTAKDALETLNLSAQALNQLAPEDQFERIAEALQGVESQADRTALAMKLWDTEGVGLLQIVNQGTDAMRAMRDEADRLGLTISQETADAMATYNDEMARFQAVATGVTRQVASELVPAMTTGLQTASEWLDQMGGAAEILDTVKDAGTGVAVVMAGRYVGAIATSQAALAAKTAVVATTTGAINLLTGATTRQAAAATAMAGATRVAAGALALIGGPLGAAVIAGSAIYYFRDELGLTGDATYQTTLDVDGLTSSFHLLTKAQQENRRASIVGDLIEMRLEAGRLGNELVEVSRLVRQSGQLTPEGGALPIATAEDIARGRELRHELNQLLANIEGGTEILSQYDQIMEELGETTRKTETSTRTLADTNAVATKAADELTRATNAQATAIENLRNRLIPGRRETVQLAKETNTLALAMAMGRGNTAQLAQMMGLLQQEYIEGQRETDNLATASEDASQRIANSFLSWETVADNTLRRIDDSGQSLWLGLIDGSESALDTVKRGFQQSLAEIAHMLTTQKLTFQVAGMMGLDTTGMPGGGGGGFSLSSLGSLKNGWDTVSGLFGGGSAASGGLYANALTGSAAAGGLYAGASTGAAVGGLYGNALTGASTTASGGFMSAVGGAMPWIGAGLLVDNLLGLGITDGIVEGISSIFGGGKSDPRLNISTRGDAGQFSHESVRTGAFGAVGFSEGTKRSNDLFGSVEQEREWLASVAALDNLTAAAARTPEQLDAMTAAVQNMVITSEDAQGAIDQLAGRTAAATSVIDSELTQSLIDAGATAEEIAQRFASASSTIDVISAASARLNLQYDAGADGALRYADSLVQAFGSVENIVAIQDAYYNAAFSDQERLQHQFDDVRGALSGLTDEAPRTVEELRAIVEASQLNGEASQKLAYDLMALAPALKQTNQAVRDAITQQYQDVLGRAPAAEGLNYWFDQVASGALTLEGALSSIANSTERLAMDNQAIWDNITSSLEDQYRTSLGRDANAEDLYYWMTQIESGAVSLDQALQLIANSTESVTLATASGVEAMRERAQLERQLLTLQGDTAELRRRELEELNPANRALQTRIWNLEYEKDAQAAANRAQQERIRNLEQEARAMMSAGQNIRQFVEGLQNTGGAGVSPETAYQNAESSFLAAISTIYTSDDDTLVQETISGITGMAQQYLSAAEAYGASGSIYQQALGLVEGSLDDLAGRLGSDELTDIDPQLQAMIDQLQTVAGNTGLAGPLAKQVPLAQTFSEFFGGSGSQNYMYRQLGALAGIEAAIRETVAKDVEESTPEGRSLSVSQAAAALRGSGNSQLASLFSSSKSTAQHAGNLEYNLGGLLNGESRGLVDTVTARTIANALDFDESRYFTLNEDVAAAVARGEFASGLQHFVSHGLQEGRKFANGGVFTNGIVNEPTLFDMGLMGEAGSEAIMPLTRHSNGSLGVRAELPPMQQFPLLNNNDALQVQRDLIRESQQLREDLKRLINASNKHLEAANVQRGAAATQQIAAIERSNKFLKRMEDDKRLEAARR